MDYAIGNTDLIRCVTKFSVDDYDSALSDVHCSMSMSVTGASSVHADNLDDMPRPRDMSVTKRVIWETEKQAEFVQNIMKQTEMHYSKT